MKPTGAIRLQAGKEKPVRNRHPWIFSGAIARVEGRPADGDIVDVLDQRGGFLARGYYNQRSQIRVRLLTWQAAQEIGPDFLRELMARAISARRALAAETTACRLVHAESDLLPGLIVDRYADYLVAQSLTLGIERWKREIVESLAALVPCAGIYERSDVDVREKEGLSPMVGLLHGQEPPDVVEIQENGRRFNVDIKRGQKTGFYLDQRVNRARVAAYCAGREVLNAFSYTGAFAVYAAMAGARRVINLDSSAEALEQSKANLALNDLAQCPVEHRVGDVFAVLREYRERGTRFDLIILDPPKFAYSRVQVESACRGYKDINWLAMQLLRPEGILCTFSCSGLVSPDLFQKVIFGASVDADRDVQILEKLSQTPDHPLLLSFPEGEYLKGLICRTL
jgi:23S rRNA (cytosine1962-C5)-methyltransferase